MSEQYFKSLNGYTVKDPNALNMGLSGMIVKEANQAPHKMYEILKTYIDNRHRLYYDTPGFVGYDYNEETGEFTPQTIYGKYNDNGEAMFPVVCSTFAWLALLGVGFENCRINTGTITDVVNEAGEHVPMLTGGENIPYSGCKTVDLTEKEIVDYWGNSGHGTVYSANMAKLFHDAGMLHKIKTKDFSEILPGDLLFFDNYVEGTQSKPPFLNINHVEMFIGWSADYMVGVSAGNDEDNPGTVHTKWKKTSTFGKKLKYYARIPAASGVSVKSASSDGSMTFTNGVTTGLTVSINNKITMKPSTAYHVVVETEPGIVGDGVYLNVFLITNGTTVNEETNAPIYISNNKAQCIAPNKYYTTIVVMDEVPGTITGVRIYGKGTGDYSVTVKSATVYEKMIQVG